jgi:hypothetical protein
MPLSSSGTLSAFLLTPRTGRLGWAACPLEADFLIKLKNYQTMNTTINLNHGTFLADSNVLMPASGEHNHGQVSSVAETLSVSPLPKKYSSSLANSPWPGSWTVKGIPELDSLLAG